MCGKCTDEYNDVQDRNSNMSHQLISFYSTLNDICNISSIVALSSTTHT